MQPPSVQSFSYAHFAHQTTIFPAVHGPHVTKLITTQKSHCQLLSFSLYLKQYFLYIFTIFILSLLIISQSEHCISVYFISQPPTVPASGFPVSRFPGIIPRSVRHTSARITYVQSPAAPFQAKRKPPLRRFSLFLFHQKIRCANSATTGSVTTVLSI